ncbi:MAG: Mrp/NBP35 family ATP-binding protein, partial [Coriobacteriales bacterium]|nr:Mrp/NBP35 family ATP-binding protein [Coriobacteriales bacterium]
MVETQESVESVEEGTEGPAVEDSEQGSAEEGLGEEHASEDGGNGASEDAEQGSGASEDCNSACSSCDVAGCGDRSAPAKLTPHPQAQIHHVIAVVSGKGGVGKSLVTSQLANLFNAKGYRVGVLDADITGPTMARAFGISDHLNACEDGLIPQETAEGIRVVSTNMVLPDETTPVLWRGSIISNLIRQFFSEVLWGELDYLFIDMPPGTGDVALTVFQSLPIDGIVIVTAPQDLVSMIVGKAINMADTMEVPILGLVENMAHFTCPDCGSEHRVFGPSTLDALADEYGIALRASLPLDPRFAEHMDRGEAARIAVPGLDAFAQKLAAGTGQLSHF